MTYPPLRYLLSGRLFLLSPFLFTGIAPAFTLNLGEVNEFTSSDDLFLDPSQNVISVNIGDPDSGEYLVKGVTFLSEEILDGVPEETRSATKNGVTVTTTRNGGGEILSWAATPPAFEGGDEDSNIDLGIIMQSIRWGLGSNTDAITVTLDGLEVNTNYDVQLLFNEGRVDSNRRFDIQVQGVLAADDFSSTGGDGMYTTSNSFAYRFVTSSDGEGKMTIQMATDLGGEAFQGTDGNPILSGLILHNGPNASAPTDILLANNTVIAGSAIGTVVGVLSSEDPDSVEHSYELVSGVGSDDNANFSIENGEIQVAADLSSGGVREYSVRVRSIDPSGLTFEKAFTIATLLDDDADGLLDAWELDQAGNLTDLDGKATGSGPGAGTGDFDGDGSSDLAEQTAMTNPTDPDSDDDGSNDGDEAMRGTNPLDSDTDDDNLNDGDEITAGSNPFEADSDGDSILDGDEVANGTLPTKADSDSDGLNDNLDPAPTNPLIFSLTNVIVGEVIEFKSPEQLGIDAARNIIAVNSLGDADLLVNGVTFFSDVAGAGVVTQNGVTVTTTAPNERIDYAIAPQFTGTDPDSATNLGLIMRNIRWSLDPDPIDIKIEGLTAGETYEIQLLVNEGNADRQLRPDRAFDIAVEETLVVDNFTSRGVEGITDWAADNSFAYTGEFTVPADGTLDIQLKDDLGGDPQFPMADIKGNPILQAIIVNTPAPDLPNIAVTDVATDLANDTVSLTWESQEGRSYSIEFSAILTGNILWRELNGNIASDGESTTTSVTLPADYATGFFRVRENR